MTNCRCGSAPLFIPPISRCGSARAFYTYQFSLRQRPRFLYCPFLVATAPVLFILPNSCCGSTPAFYTAHFWLRQRPGFFYCPFLVAAAPRNCTARFSLRQRPSFLYCLFLVAAAPHFLYCPDRKSTRLNSSHVKRSRMPSSA